MNRYDKGSSILIEVQFKKWTPFASSATLFNPSTTQTITVIDPSGKKVVNAQALTNSTTGLYYYVIQTTTSWVVGEYNVQITSQDTTYSDVTALNKSDRFYLR
jgi:hypothetical protein